MGWVGEWGILDPIGVLTCFFFMHVKDLNESYNVIVILNSMIVLHMNMILVLYGYNVEMPISQWIYLMSLKWDRWANPNVLF